jgi:hypothetical protein
MEDMESRMEWMECEIEKKINMLKKRKLYQKICQKERIHK